MKKQQLRNKKALYIFYVVVFYALIKCQPTERMLDVLQVDQHNIAGNDNGRCV